MKKGVYINMIKYIVLNDNTIFKQGSLYDDKHTISRINYYNQLNEYVLVLTTNGKPVANVIVQRHAVAVAFDTLEDKS